MKVFTKIFFEYILEAFMKHQMNLNPIPFSLVRNGDKIIELRLDDEKRNCIMIGDDIEFVNTEDASILLAMV